ncbi:MAG: helix-turn-helix domain-containing protein [Pseudonocardiaceae bacterium]
MVTQTTDYKLAHSVDETCRYIGVGRTVLFDLLRRGEISSVKIGRRRLIPAASLQAYFDRLVAEQSGTGAA